MAIADYLNKLIELKNQLVANLKSMGVTADESEKLNTLVPKVLDIETGFDTSDATATAEDIAVGKTAYANGEKLTGTLEQNVEWVDSPSGAFTYGCEIIKKLVIPEGITNIIESARDHTALNYTALEELYLPRTLKKIDVDQFPVLSKLQSPCNISTFGDRGYSVYGSDSLVQVNIIKSITTSDLAEYAFRDCDNLNTVTIESGITKIGDYAFWYCGSLENITIPDSVTSIGKYVFASCKKLKDIYYTGTQEQWNAITKGTEWNANMGSNVTGGTVIHYNCRNWSDIRNMVRNGTIQNYYSIGDQLPVYYNGNKVLFDIVAFDVAIPSDSNYTHSMTLMPHDCIDNLMIDNAEPNNSDSDIASKGNNRYAYSGIRQYLNSDKAAGEWWTAQHSTDTAPDYATTKAGFMSRFDSNFLSVIGKTKYRVAKNTITDGGGYEDLEDFFYLPSKMEVGLGTENGISEGALFPYFDSADKRIKNYGSNTQVYWWLRTPQTGVSYNTALTGYSTGVTYIANSNRNFTIAPVCNII